MSEQSPRSRRREWRCAWRDLAGLIENPERTDLVFGILEAPNLAHPAGIVAADQISSTSMAARPAAT